ncbi:MAG TPA: MaoC family dehydratase [Gemmatimonadales bacterium]|nr:MaoC family dehydratase [Gemmatimonadales bacterium]
MDRPIYLDDLQVGQRFTTATHGLDEPQIIAFAREFDPQPFHLDAARARDLVFGELVASGWHTAAITMRLLVTSGHDIAGGLIGLGGEIAWPAPARPGDVLQATVEVIAVTPSRSRPDRGTATLRIETRNQREETVQILTVKILVPRAAPRTP